jgi:hypothetical protein
MTTTISDDTRRSLAIGPDGIIPDERLTKARATAALLPYPGDEVCLALLDHIEATKPHPGFALDVPPPTAEERKQEVINDIAALRETVEANLKPSRGQSLVLTKLDEAFLWMTFAEGRMP